MSAVVRMELLLTLRLLVNLPASVMMLASLLSLLRLPWSEDKEGGQIRDIGGEEIRD